MSPNLNRSRLSLFGFLDLHGCSDAPLVADQNNGAICLPGLDWLLRLDARSKSINVVPTAVIFSTNCVFAGITGAPEACTIVFPDVIVNVNSSVGGDVAVCTCTTTDAPVGSGASHSVAPCSVFNALKNAGTCPTFDPIPSVPGTTIRERTTANPLNIRDPQRFPHLQIPGRRRFYLLKATTARYFIVVALVVAQRALYPFPVVAVVCSELPTILVRSAPRCLVL